MNSLLRNRKDEGETATVRKLKSLTEDSVYVVEIITSITNQEIVGSAPISFQRLIGWSDGRS